MRQPLNIHEHSFPWKPHAFVRKAPLLGLPIQLQSEYISYLHSS